MRDKRLDQLSTGFFKGWCAAEVGRVCLDQCGIKVVLADQEAEAIPEPRLTIVRAIWDLRVFLLPTNLRGIWRSGEPSQLFNGAKPNPVRLPQSAVEELGWL